MFIFSVILLTITTLAWVVCYFTVRSRFADLKSNLAQFYRSDIAVASDIGEQQSLVALCVDLSRKAHSTIQFEALTPQEHRLILHTHAIEVLPAWMSYFAALALKREDRAMIARLRKVHTSRPNKPALHFGAIRQQQQLRSGPES